MSVTVAVCTLARPRLLHQTLESLAGMDDPGGLAWEVLVVDNGGLPETADVVDAFGQHLPVRRVREEKLGLSHARNRSVAEARSPWIAWIDDDVQVDSGWLRAYDRAVSGCGDAAFLGGPIRPWFEGSPPDWLRQAYGSVPAVRAAYGERRLGPEPRTISEWKDLPYGGNFAVRTDALPGPRPFDPALGRRGTELLGGEELEVLQRMIEAGHHGRWVPDAGIRHVIPPGRQTLGHLRAYFHGQGRVQEPLSEDLPVAELFGRPRWALRTWFQEELSYRLLRPFTSPERWIPHMIEASFAAGALKGPPERPGSAATWNAGRKGGGEDRRVPGPDPAPVARGDLEQTGTDP